MMKTMKMKPEREFFKFVIPSMVAFALSGVYAIVDGYFVGNTVGDAGLSAINIAYPIQAVMQALGTGIGMGGAVYYSINMAKGDEKKARDFVATGWWLLVIASALVTAAVYGLSVDMLKLLGASGTILDYATDYIKVVAIGSVLQVLSTGFVPFIRNYGGAFCSMVAMVAGFITNIILDFALVWVYGMGMKGAALATIIGQGVTAAIAIGYAICQRKFYLKVSPGNIKEICASTFRIGLAPFGLALTPNLSLVLINRFSATYGGEKAIATYACISYVICIIYLIMQGVGDGSQPLMSRFYGEGSAKELKTIQKMAYTFAIIIAAAGAVIMYMTKGYIGVLFGASAEVSSEISNIVPIFLVSLPFIAVTRIATAAFYATEKSALSYILTFIEPVLMLAFMLILPRAFGGQVMIWWSTVFARIVAAALAVILTAYQHRIKLEAQQQ